MGRYVFRCIMLVAAAAFAASGAAVEVSSFEDLEKIGSEGWPLDGKYDLTRDIDASASRNRNRGEGFAPIGSVKAPFTGEFYGNGFKVSGLYINRPDADHVGMFGFLGGSAVVKGLSVVADTVIGRYAVGALAGGSDGLIRGCYSAGFVQAAIKEREGNVGGLVGVNGGRVAASFSGATVNGKAHVGGLVGFLTSEISESYAVGAVSGDNYVGGLVGYAFGGSINMCFSTGMVIGTGKRSVVGGLVGYDFGASNANWNSAGRVTVGADAGKLVKEADITDCYWNINTSGISVSAGGEGASTSAMASDSIFKGWDFDSTWASSDTSLYPILKDIPVFTITYRAEYNGKLQVKGAGEKVDMCVMELGEGSPGFEIRAIPNANYRFLRWSDGNRDSVRRDAAFADKIFIAEFEISPDAETKTLTYSALNNGNIRISGPNSAITSRTYSIEVITGAYGIEIEAVADPGYRFYHWVEDGSRESKRVDMAVDDENYTALFIKDNGDSSVIGHGYTTSHNGSLRVNGVTDLLLHGDTLGSDIVTVPKQGYRFSGWNDGDNRIIRTDSVPDVFVVRAGFSEIRESGVILISTFEALRAIGSARSPLSADYRLAGDINVPAGEEFEPVGSAENPFTGTFVGDGYAIRGLRVNCSGGAYCGLFGYAKDAAIRGVRVENVSVAGGDNSGGLVGYCENTYIDRCGSSGSVSGGGNAGGLAGRIKGSVIDYCYSHADVTAAAGGSAGGLIGTVSRGAVFQSYSTGQVTGSGGSIGGFIGACPNCKDGREVLGCYWDVESSGKELSAGGSGVFGQTTEPMMLQTTYINWSIGYPSSSGFVWAIEDVLVYPYLASSNSAVVQPSPKRRQDSAPSVSKPSVKVRGKTLSVRAPANSAVQVRLVDMRGRTFVRYKSAGSAEFSLKNIPAGRYIAETKIDGRRADVRRVFFSD